MKEFSKYVGLDVHKDTIAVAVADAGGGEVRFVGEIAHTPEAITKLLRQLKKGAGRISWCYEAGPCGYGLYRQLIVVGEDCQVVAPSLIPKKAGDRVKADRRDALSLARLHRAGELTAVWVPDQAQEALRDLPRAREDNIAPTSLLPPIGGTKAFKGKGCAPCASSCHRRSRSYVVLER